MSEHISTTAEPAYIAKLALSALPFAPLKRRDEFYDSGQHGQTYKLLLHLLRSTKQNIVLQASEGLGKTTLLQLLSSEESTDLRFCRYDPTITSDAIYAELGKAFSVQNTAFLSGASERQALEQLLQTLKQRHIKPVLLIDDVEQLDSEKLKRLVELANKQYEDEPLLQVIISCSRYSPVVQQTFANSHNIALSALDLAEIKAYLSHRLSAVGFQGESPFSDKEITTLYKKSQGNIKQLNILAHQHLLRGKRRPNLSISLPQLKLSGSWLKLVAGVFAVLLVLTVLLFQDDINQWVTGQPDAVIEDAEPELSLNDDVVMVEADEVQSSTHTVRPEDELERLLAELETEKVIQPQVDITASESPAIDASPETTVQGKEWVLVQSGVNYTFQLKGAWTRQEIDAYIEAYQLTGEMAVFTSLRNEKPWYVLVYGSYQNKNAAVQASKEWTAPLNTLPTWLRRFDSVQKQIKELGVTP